MSERQPVTHLQTDEELIAAYQQGNPAAYNVLVGRYKDQLINYVFRYLGDYDEADDVVQETFIRVYRKKEQYKPIAKFSTWIYTIATNLSKTRLQRNKRHSIFSLNRSRRGEDEKSIDIPDSRENVEAFADNILKQEMIQDALMKMSSKYRDVVILFEIQELTYDEICAITGLNIGTVKSRLNRGRAQLRELLKDLSDE